MTTNYAQLLSFASEPQSHWIMFVPYVALWRTVVVNMRSVVSKVRVGTCVTD